MDKQTIKSVISTLPEIPGVYRFCKDHNGNQPVYIGKSINIKKRVLDHWYRSVKEHKEQRIIGQTQSIHYTPTAGDVGAQLLESTLVKQYVPRFNRRLRRLRQIHLLKLNQNADDFLTLQCVSRQNLTQIDNNSFGFFTSKKKAVVFIRELAQKNQLCLNRLGIERLSTPCFNFQIKQCQGACCGKETATQHNQRLRQALDNIRHQVWPYPGAIALVEKFSAEYQQAHIIWHWHYIRSIDMNQNTTHHDLISHIAKPQTLIDIDHYKILAKFLTQLPSNCEVISLYAPSSAAQ